MTQSRQTGEDQALKHTGPQALGLAFLVALAAGSVLCGYEMLRSTANTLFVQAYGKQALPWALGLTLLGVALLTYLYGRLLSWLGPRHTMLATTFLALCTMVLGYGAVLLGVRPALVALFVFKESYVVLLIEQIWSYIDSQLDGKTARRLNGPICGVAGVGAVLGGLLLGWLSKRFGTQNMLLLAAVATLPALPLFHLLFARFGPPRGQHRSKQDHLALHLFRSERVLLFLIALIAMTQIISTVLEIAWKSTLQDHWPDADQQNAFSGNYYALINFAAMFFQFLGAPLMLSVFSARTVHILIPIVNLFALAYMFFSPSVWGCAVAYGVFKTLDYSIFRASKELLYLPLSFDARYRSKEVIDVLGNRVSKGLASIAVTFFQWAGVVFSTLIYATTGLVAVIFWLVLAFPLTAKNPRASRQLPSEELPEKTPRKTNDQSSKDERNEVHDIR